MSIHYVVQEPGVPYTELFQQALSRGEFNAIDAAVAYATVGGVRVLTDLFASELGNRWPGLKKRWLVGIDWCRSDPPALVQLNKLGASAVRVPDGKHVISSDRCLPRVTYHPKLYMLSGPEKVAIISGSGNLSANGLKQGCECGNLHVADRGSDQAFGLSKWFDRAWSAATNLDEIHASYKLLCEKKTREGIFYPNDDDQLGATRKGALTLIQLQQLRTFGNLWIQGGALGGNLGKGKPGSQLDMKRNTRVFFGFLAEDLPANEEIGAVELIWDGQSHPEQTLRFDDNSMDKINIPPAGERGRSFYKDKFLLFSRISSRSYQFMVGGEAERQQWQKASHDGGVVFPKVGKREWGVF